MIAQPNTIRLTIIRYPGAMQSAIAGLSELFDLANRLIAKQQGVLFEVQVLPYQQDVLIHDIHANQIIILPPCTVGEFYTEPTDALSEWLRTQHAQGAVLCSICAGAFLLAQTGLLAQRPATTHWMLAEPFAQRFPDVCLDDSKILINDGDLITAGGLMAWLDLGLELVAQFSHPTIMRQLGKQLVVDTGPREQRYYRQFMPRLDHGDRAIRSCQHHMQRYYNTSLPISTLAKHSHLTERTFLRRFVRATGLKPSEYLQQLRIAKACDALESDLQPIEIIAASVGYEDTSAFRKTFIKITGLTPRDFRNRFGRK